MDSSQPSPFAGFVSSYLHSLYSVIEPIFQVPVTLKVMHLSLGQVLALASASQRVYQARLWRHSLQPVGRKARGGFGNTRRAESRYRGKKYGDGFQYRVPDRDHTYGRWFQAAGSQHHCACEQYGRVCWRSTSYPAIEDILRNRNRAVHQDFIEPVNQSAHLTRGGKMSDDKRDEIAAP